MSKFRSVEVFEVLSFRGFPRVCGRVPFFFFRGGAGGGGYALLVVGISSEALLGPTE